MRATSAEARIRRSAAETAAMAGLLALVVAVPLAPLDMRLAGYRIADVVTFLLPLAVVLAFPFLRRLGAARMPALSLELPALVFLALALPSVVFAESQGGAALSWVRYALYFALALVSAAVFKRRANRRVVLVTFSAVALVTTLFAAAQYIRPAAADLVFTASGEPTRVFATFVNPNFYAEYLLLSIAVGLALFFSERGAGRVAACVPLGACALALVVTYTRGSWLGLAAGIAVGAVLVDLRLLWAVLGVGGVLLAAVPTAWQRLLSVFTVEGSSAQRLVLWSEALGIIREHPVVGVGIGGYSAAVERMRGPASDGTPQVLGAHDSYLQLTAEVGVLGGLAFVWTVLAVIVAGFRQGAALREDAAERGVNAALSAGLVAFALNAAVSNSFQHPQAAVFFWLLAGMQASVGSAVVRARYRPVTGSRFARIVFGSGAPDAPDLADWETKAG